MSCDLADWSLFSGHFFNNDFPNMKHVEVIECWSLVPWASNFGSCNYYRLFKENIYILKLHLFILKIWLLNLVKRIAIQLMILTKGYKDLQLIEELKLVKLFLGFSQTLRIRNWLLTK